MELRSSSHYDHESTQKSDSEDFIDDYIKPEKKGSGHKHDKKPKVRISAQVILTTTDFNENRILDNTPAKWWESLTKNTLGEIMIPFTPGVTTEKNDEQSVLATKLSEALSLASSQVSLGETVVSMIVRNTTTSKFNTPVQVLTHFLDRKMPTESKPGLTDPNMKALDISCDRALKAQDLNKCTVYLVLSPKSAAARFLTPGTGDKDNDGKKRGKRKNRDEDDDDVIVVTPKDDVKENLKPPKRKNEVKDLTTLDDEEDEDSDPLIPTRFFICNGPIVERQKLVLRPNSRNCAQGDWSAIMHLKKSIVASNVQIIKLLDTYARTKLVDSNIYTPYRASDVTTLVDRKEYMKVTLQIPNREMEQNIRFSTSQTHHVGLFLNDVIDSSCNRKGGSGEGIGIPHPVIAPLVEEEIDFVQFIQSNLSRKTVDKGAVLVNHYALDPANRPEVEYFWKDAQDRFKGIGVRNEAESKGAHMKRFWDTITTKSKTIASHMTRWRKKNK